MFLDNKYKRWYFEIIERAKGRNRTVGYTERHHAVPKALGGSNRLDNIVILTYREHFICHWLLTKFTEGDLQRKMFSALIIMCERKYGRIPASWQYELKKIYGYKAFKGRRHTNETKEILRKSSTGNKNRVGKKHTEEAKRKISVKRMGTIQGFETREKKRLAALGNKHLLGHRHNEQTRDKMRSSHMARPYKDRAVWLGKKLSKEHRRKISGANKLRHALNRVLRMASRRSKFPG